MKKLSGFSLMEMLVVLLIVSVVAAASAPMINKKLLGAAADKSPWVWTGNNNNIAYNLQPGEQTASIGAVNPPTAASRARLYIDTRVDSGSNFTPHIAFGQSGANIMKLTTINDSIWFSKNNVPSNSAANAVVVGSNARAAGNNTIAIGSASNASAENSVVIGGFKSGWSDATNSINIGYDIRGGGTDSIALGANSSAHYTNAIAIGRSSNADWLGAVSIGAESNAWWGNSIALGNQANAYQAHSVAIGGGSNCYGGNNAVAIGAYSSCISSNNSIAVGPNSNALMPNSVSIGANAYVPGGNSVQARAIAIGYNAVSNASDAIAIGGRYGANATRATNTATIAIGSTVLASGKHAIAIGGTGDDSSDAETGMHVTTMAKAEDSIALGIQACANHTKSVAIGKNAATTAANQIVLGTANDTVYIPGKLVVDKTTFLGAAQDRYNSTTYLYHKTWGKDHWHVRSVEVNSGSNDDFRWGASDHTTRFPDYSDRRLKNVGKAFTGSLEQIKKLQVFNYTFKDDKSKTPRVGVMAQDLQKIFPQAVIKGEDGFLKIRMEDMFYALVNAVKEIDSRVTTLEKNNNSRITALEKENKELKKRLNELEKKIK